MTMRWLLYKYSMGVVRLFMWTLGSYPARKCLRNFGPGRGPSVHRMAAFIDGIVNLPELQSWQAASATCRSSCTAMSQASYL